MHSPGNTPPRRSAGKNRHLITPKQVFDVIDISVRSHLDAVRPDAELGRRDVQAAQKPARLCVRLADVGELGRARAGLPVGGPRGAEALVGGLLAEEAAALALLGAPFREDDDHGPLAGVQAAVEREDPDARGGGRVAERLGLRRRPGPVLVAAEMAVGGGLVLHVHHKQAIIVRGVREGNAVRGERSFKEPLAGDEAGFDL